MKPDCCSVRRLEGLLYWAACRASGAKPARFRPPVTWTGGTQGQQQSKGRSKATVESLARRAGNGLFVLDLPGQDCGICRRKRPGQPESESCLVRRGRHSPAASQCNSAVLSPPTLRPGGVSGEWFCRAPVSVAREARHGARCDSDGPPTSFSNWSSVPVQSCTEAHEPDQGHPRRCLLLTRTA